MSIQWSARQQPRPLPEDRWVHWFDREKWSEVQFAALLLGHDPQADCYCGPQHLYLHSAWRRDCLTPDQAAAMELVLESGYSGKHPPRNWVGWILGKRSVTLPEPMRDEAKRLGLVAAVTAAAAPTVPRDPIDDALAVLRAELTSFPEVQQRAGEALLRWAWACGRKVIDRPDWNTVASEFERLGGATERDATSILTFKWGGGETSNKRLRETILERVNRVLERCPPPAA